MSSVNKKRNVKNASSHSLTQKALNKKCILCKSHTFFKVLFATEVNNSVLEDE